MYRIKRSPLLVVNPSPARFSSRLRGWIIHCLDSILQGGPALWKSVRNTGPDYNRAHPVVRERAVKTLKTSPRLDSSLELKGGREMGEGKAWGDISMRKSYLVEWMLLIAHHVGGNGINFQPVALVVSKRGEKERKKKERINSEGTFYSRNYPKE